jgi:hypothetical protein
LHATEYDQENNTFTGHLHPKEIKCGANFYNMKIMKEWPADLRRTAFMSKPMILKDGYDLESSHKDNQFCEWEDSLMRCVHVRFLQQSSNEKEDVIGKRLSPQQTLGYRLSPKDAGRNRKYNLRNIYRQGPITTIDASNFINKA